MNSLSLALIVKNEEKHLPNVLKYAKVFADEIVIIDTGSTDNTINIAKQFTDNVYKYKWKDDFSDARNYSISKCTKDFIIWLDADDFILEDSAIRIKSLLSGKISWDVCYIPYRVGYYLIKRERIFRNNKGIKFVYPIHECLKFDGLIHKSDVEDIIITHNKIYINENGTDRNLRILSKCINNKVYKKDSRIWGHLGGEYSMKLDTDNAIKSYKKAIKYVNGNNSESSKHYYHLALEYKKLNNNELALENLWESIKRNLFFKEAYFELGKIYYDLNKLDESLFIFLSILNINDKSVKYIIEEYKYNNGYLYDWISIVYGKKLDYKNALIYVEMALSFNKNDIRLLDNKNYWLEKISAI